MALSRDARRNQSRSNGANVGKNYNIIVDISLNSPDEAGGRKCKLRYDLTQHKPSLSPTSSDFSLELKLWIGRTKPHQTPYALNGVAQGYLPRRGYRGRCAIHTPHPSLCFFVAYSLGFEISSAWTSSIEYASDMASIFPQTWFGPQFKHVKGVDIFMGDIESLSSYPNYW